MIATLYLMGGVFVMLESFLIVNPKWPLGASLVPMLMGRDNDNRIYILGFDSDNHEQYLTRLSAQVGPVEGVADVDTGFGEGGFVAVNLGSGLRIERALSIVDTTATHLTISYEVLNDIGLYQIALLRVLVNGQVDTTFGENGVALFPQLPEPAQAQETQAETSAAGNGQVLAKGQMLCVAFKMMFGQKFSYLVKVNEDGTLDSSFAGGAGYLRLSFAGMSNGGEYKLSVDSKERAVVVSGTADSARAMAARFTADGVLDPGFGGSGFIEISSPTGALRQPAMSVDGNDNVVISVKHIPADSGPEGLYLFRLDEHGAADPAFNHGRPIEWLPGAAMALHTTDHLVIDEQRRIVLRSVYEDRTTRARGILVSRFTAQGIDGSFGESGSFALPGSGSFYGGLVIQSGSEGAVVASDRQSLWKVMP